MLPAPLVLVRSLRSLVLASLVVSLSACQSAAQQDPPAGADAVTHNTLTPSERDAGWQLLFDGTSLTGWRVFKESGTPTGWSVVDGTLARVGPGGDLITVDQFADFELTLDWKLEPGGNSGIFFRVTEDVDRTFEGAPEMQVLDDVGHADAVSRLTSAGANYALHPASEGAVKPVGEWNSVRIVVDGPLVQHWLNGTQVVEYELWTPEWEELVRNSKFVEWPAYGRAERGHIGLQDHGDPVYYRNIKVRALR